MDRVVEDLRSLAAAELAIPASEVDADARWERPGAAFEMFRALVESRWEVPLYRQELSRFCSIRELARYLVQETDPGATREYPPIDDPYEGEPPDAGVDLRQDAAARPRPIVFILCAPRSGSTLLRAMLAGHPDLVAPPELHLLPFASLGAMAWETQTMGFGWMRRGLVTAFVALKGLSPVMAEMHVAGLEAQDVPIGEVYAELQRLASPRLIVDKTPTYALHPAWLRRAESLFESARYIHLTRHPYAVMESFVRLRFHRLLGKHWPVWDENPWRYAEKCWGVSQRHVLDFLRGVPDSRHMRVRFEDLAARPEEALRQIVGFLELPFDPALLTPFVGERWLRDGDGKGAAIGDPRFLSRSALDGRLGEKWREIRLPRPLTGFTRGVAEELGYDL